MIGTTMETPLGQMLLCADTDGLREIWLPSQRDAWPDPITAGSSAVLEEAILQLTEYFAGQRTCFSLTLAPAGTAFQRRVWDALCTIPYGATVSYRAVAEQIGAPKAMRAVGAANGRNPLPIVVPCHRVIGASGQLVGYGGGLPVKRRLLDLEQGQTTTA